MANWNSQIVKGIKTKEVLGSWGLSIMFYFINSLQITTMYDNDLWYLAPKSWDTV